MSKQRQRLELTWIGKEKRPRLEPRILLEDPAHSHHAATRVSDNDIFDNRLIFGDNLLALKALEQEFAGKVKCVYIDPPFNTGDMMEHYDDSLEHSIWLTRMRDRLQILRSLMSPDGTFFLHIDDNELGYAVVVLDEVFGRSNRCYIVTFVQGATTGHKSINPGMVTTSNFVLVYARDKSQWRPNRVFSRLAKRDDRYGTFINNRGDPPSSWKFRSLLSAFAESISMSERGLKKTLGDRFESLITEFVESNAYSVVRLARPDYNAVGAAMRDAIDDSARNPTEVMLYRRENAPDVYLLGGATSSFLSRQDA